MQGDTVVISDPARYLVEDDRSGREIGTDDLVSPKRVHKCFCHAVGLWARGRRRNPDIIEPLSRSDRVQCCVHAAATTEPLNRRGRTPITAPAFIRAIAPDEPGVCASDAAARRSGQLPAVNIHYAADPLRVVLNSELAIHQRLHAPSTVRRTLSSHRTNLDRDRSVVGSA